MKCLRLDNGGEYVARHLKYTCHIMVSLGKDCTLHTLSNNDILKERIRLGQMAHCFLQAKGLLTRFWEEAIYFSNYLLNLILTKVVWNMTLFEKWSGRKPSVGHLKTFGCIMWAHILDDKMEEVGCKESCLYLMGYSEELKAYKLFDPVKQEIICREIFFDEKTLGITLLNSSSSLLSSDPFEI
jgi:hypothetical protein